jgi:predicted NAD-dependent protein-ADP-ribosyltransferase YbiA (DUF1768 family)
MTLFQWLLPVVFALTSSVALAQTNPPPHSPPYPAHWWKYTDPTGAPKWEILPQAAGYGEVILSKRNELGGSLSNFAPTPFEFRGKKYASVEGLWQGTKYPENSKDPRAIFQGISWPFTRLQVEAMSGFEAKDAGTPGSDNMKKMGIDWVSLQGKHYTYKETGDSEFYKLIVEVMRAKLAQNPEVKKVLLQTGDLKLRPDHDSSPTELKAWQYHQIWMDLRKDLQKSNSAQ